MVGTCRECLATNLYLLEEAIDLIRRALISTKLCTLDFGEIFRVSELVRMHCVSALAAQYRRLAAGRLVPQELPIPRPKAALQSGEPDVGPVSHEKLPENHSADAQTTIWSSNSILAYQSEPPSPPPTPKRHCDDWSQTGGAVESEMEGSWAPRNGVFSIFCPVAVAWQVDRKRVASKTQQRCECGFQWSIPELPETEDSVRLKEGFRLTKRFLAKSHCSVTSGDNSSPGSETVQGNPGYGCVLCTSTGRTETYTAVDDLRIHIDAVHTKWQMLHDPDLT